MEMSPRPALVPVGVRPFPVGYKNYLPATIYPAPGTPAEPFYAAGLVSGQEHHLYPWSPGMEHPDEHSPAPNAWCRHLVCCSCPQVYSVPGL